MSSYRPTACVDFDGVLASYTGWKGPDHIGDPLPGAAGFLRDLQAHGMRVVIHSTRDADAIRGWLRRHGMADLVADVTSHKVPALVYVDDRAVTFRGDFDAALEEVRGFRTWWEPGHDPERADP